MDKFTYIVQAEDVKYRIKDILRHQFTFSSRLRTKLKQNHAVYLNGVPTEGWILPQEGDVISIRLPEESSAFDAEDIPILPVYEDEDLLIINKLPGYVVHPTRGQPAHTIANGIMKYMQDTGQRFKIRFVNRLDRDTSGLLIVAKNSYAQEELTKQMKQNQTRKYYKTILCGLLEKDCGTIDRPIGRPNPERIERGILPESDGGYASVTHYRVLTRREEPLIRLDSRLTIENGLVEGPREAFSEREKERLAGEGLAAAVRGCTLAEILLETGRTHQIRVHMGSLGHWVVGDTLYGGVLCKKEEDGWYRPIAPRQLLHAGKLRFRHPVRGNEMEVEAPLPEDFFLRG